MALRPLLTVTALTLGLALTANPGALAQEADRGGLLDRLFGGTERFGERAAAQGGQAGADRAAPGPADVILRLDRLETHIRQLTGTIEQLQHRNQQLEQLVRRLQEESEHRESGAKGAPRSATPVRPPAAPGSAAAAPPGTPGRRGDAFDPTQHPNAPGAPRTLGSVPAGTGMPADPAQAAPPAAAAPPTSPRSAHAAGAASAPLPGAGGAKEDYDLAYGHVMRKDYAMAEEGFRNFLQKHPSDQMAGEATFWLGESLYQRQRFRDAAEAFLNVSTRFEGNARGPDALLRLGQSLAALGEKEAACASLGEVSRKFPRAPTSLKQSVEREQKRVRC